MCFFFFSSRRRHTRFDCDWSSDVCSSDLSIAPDSAKITTPFSWLSFSRIGPINGRTCASCRASPRQSLGGSFFACLRAGPEKHYNFVIFSCVTPFISLIGPMHIDSLCGKWLLLPVLALVFFGYLGATPAVNGQTAASEQIVVTGDDVAIASGAPGGFS